MGLKKDEDRKPKLPPIYSGKAIRLRFPDMTVVMPNGQQQKHRFEIMTFPDWSHKVVLNNKVWAILGKDLELGMQFSFNGDLLSVIEIDKEQLYHGMMLQDPKIGDFVDLTKAKRYKCVRLINAETGNQSWEINEFEDNSHNWIS